MKSEQILTSGNIKLVDLTLEHCTQTYVNWLNDPTINRFLESRWFPQDIDSVKQFVTSVSSMKNAYMFAIINEENQHIGNIKIDCIHPVHKKAEIGYMIGDKASHGKGYGSTAIKLICDFGFKNLDLHRISAHICSLNIASRKALMKARFVYESTQKSASIDNSPNKWEDNECFVVFKDDWLQ